MHGRLSNEIAILATNLIDLISRAISTLPEEDINLIKKLAFEYDQFGNWIAYLGNGRKFDEAGNSIFKKTDELLEIINSKIAEE